MCLSVSFVASLEACLHWNKRCDGSGSIEGLFRRLVPALVVNRPAHVVALAERIVWKHLDPVKGANGFRAGLNIRQAMLGLFMV